MPHTTRPRACPPPFPLDNAGAPEWDGEVLKDSATEVTDVFEEHRSVLFGVAYRMLGRVADAEDVVQDAWLRWSGADHAAVREPRAFLVRITTRLAIDRLRQVQSRRESYVGPWLPEPLRTDVGGITPDTAERAVFTESVTLAVLVVLESLSLWSARCSCCARPSAIPTRRSPPLLTAVRPRSGNWRAGPGGMWRRANRATRSIRTGSGT